MTRVIPNTAQGVENISAIFSARSNATTALESIVSIGDVAPGEAQGTNNSWIGIRGAFTRTFAHWRHVSQRNPRHEGTREEFHEGTREESRSRRSPLAATSVVRASAPSRPIRYGGSTRRAGHSTRGPPPLAAARRARARCRCELKRWARTPRPRGSGSGDGGAARGGRVGPGAAPRRASAPPPPLPRNPAGATRATMASQGPAQCVRRATRRHHHHSCPAILCEPSASARGGSGPWHGEQRRAAAAHA